MKIRKNHRNIFIVITLVIGVFFAITFINNLQDSSNSDFTQEEQIAPHYVEYSEGMLAKAKTSGRPILYFWASWCPTCKVLDQELRERGSELPDDVTILKVNFDTQKDLKEKYFVTQQHTLVQIDENGTEVNKWIGGNMEVIKQQLK